MRDIKFRAWDKTINKILISNKIFINTAGRILNFANPNHELIIMQYTGILDKNGKEIYEGDMVKYNDITTVVKWKENWDDCECSFAGYSFPSTNPKNLEVIGNIYQNQELLEGDKKWSCDREIDKEALAKVIFSYNFPTEKWEEVHKNTNKHYLLLADHIISTMPTWLKRIEK